ncbi:hypothetical protein [Rouxiella sp. WC2420]|uniref:Uncharacterized protein n=1 Tax=Rouxiella sp. WC2420 TaxID=3234145 RepID=A0AB39VTD1_9GAMM
MPKIINVNNIPGYKPVKTIEKDFPNKTSLANHVNNVGNNSNSSPESNILCTDPFIGINMERVYSPCQNEIQKPLPTLKIFMALGTIALIGGSMAYASGALRAEEAENLLGRGNHESNKNLIDLGFSRGFSGKMEAKHLLAIKVIDDYNKSPNRSNPLPPRRVLSTPKDNKRLIIIDHIIKDVAASFNSFETNISHDNKSLEKMTGSQRELFIKRISLYKKAQQEIATLQAAILKITSNMNISVYNEAKALITLIDSFCKKFKAMDENASEIVKIPQNLLSLSQLLEIQQERLETLSS